MKNKKQIIFGLLVFLIASPVSASTYLGSLSYSSSTNSAVDNVGESIGFASGTINSILVYDVPNTGAQLQFRPCDSFITDPVFNFHLDMDLNAHCSGGPYWNYASGTVVDNTTGLMKFTIASSSLATSTYPLTAGNVYALLWYNRLAGGTMKCQTTSTANGKIFSNGSPNTNDDIGSCNDFPYMLIGELGISTVIKKATPEVESCSYTGSFLGFDWPTGDDLICYAKQAGRSVSDSVFNPIKQFITTNLFPVSLFYHWNSLIASTSISAVPGISVTMPTGQVVQVISSGTIAQASTESGINIRDWIGKGLYVVTGIIVTGLGVVCFL